MFVKNRNGGGASRVIVIHNPDTGAYCVLQMWENDDAVQIVSWHRAPEKYGNRKWSKN